MATELHFRDGSAWRKAKEVHFHDGSVWRKAKEVWVHDGTAWRKSFTAAQVVTADWAGLTFEQTTVSPTVSISYAEFQTNGQVFNADGLVGKWHDPVTGSIGSSYWIRATKTSGDLPDGTLGTWLSLATARAWSFTRSTVGTSSCELSVQISSDSSGTVIVGSATIFIQATQDA